MLTLVDCLATGRSLARTEDRPRLPHNPNRDLMAALIMAAIHTLTTCPRTGFLYHNDYEWLVEGAESIVTFDYAAMALRLDSEWLRSAIINEHGPFLPPVHERGPRGKYEKRGRPRHDKAA